jgi:hypothetical protein
MNYSNPYSSFPDHTITAAWDSQVKQADKAPGLTHTLADYESELFTRFAARYTELRVLPRAARRALQRQLARSSELAAILTQHFQQGGRRLQHRMAWSLAGAALLLALGQGVGTAATITVTTNDPNIRRDGQCSLIEAIVNANNDRATYRDCAAGNGADTIVLPTNANVTLNAVFGYTYGQFGGSPVGLPPITSQITIEGNGATIARQGNALAFGLIFVKGNGSSPGVPPTPGDLTLRNLTLTGGSSFFGLANNGTLSIENSIVSDNTGSGVSNNGTLSIENSIVSGNTGNGVSTNGTLIIANSTVSDNTGSGVSNGATLIIKNSTISGNQDRGVGNSGTLTIENGTLSGNSTNNNGGGLSNIGRVTINNSTISGNTAKDGGGISNFWYCYYGCSAGTITITNSLVSGNQAIVAPEVENNNDCPVPSPTSCVGAPATINANNFNLFGTNGDTGICGFTPGPTDIVPAPGIAVANILGPLEDNGGPTQTHALLAGSPAVDAGDPNGCQDNLGVLLLTDQRGFPRPSAGTICDIGSYELQAAASPSNSPVNVALPADTVSVSETCTAPATTTPLAIAATTLATGEAGASFTGDLMISGGVAPYIVSITKGALPAGLSLGNDGIISGTISPRAKGGSITVRITDSINDSITQTFTITVTKALSVSAKVKTGRMGRNYNASFKIKGGQSPFTWSITAGALPMGLSFNNATGAITGIPTESGQFPLTVQVTDDLGGVAAVNPTLTIQ